MPNYTLHLGIFLHAVKLRHGTDGFTSPLNEDMLRIFFALKIRRLRPGANPRTWVPKASTLPLEHRSSFAYWLPGDGLLVSPDLNNRSKPFTPAITEGCVQGSLVWSSRPVTLEQLKVLIQSLLNFSQCSTYNRHHFFPHFPHPAGHELQVSVLA